jgi:cell division protein FtsW (lipid II flippase)
MKNLLSKITPAKGSFAAKTLAWLACGAIAGLHSWTLSAAPYQAATVMWVFPLLVLVPGLVSALLLPGELRHWYRWIAILGLTYSSYAEFIGPITFIGTLWALHQAWVIERTVPLRTLFTLRRTKTSVKDPKTA